MFWNTVPKVPWGGPPPPTASTSRSRRRDGVGHKGASTRRRQASPEPYSLGHLRVLFQRLIDAQEGKVKGETIVVETLRAISEVVVYGENQDAKVAAKAAAKAQEKLEEEAAAAAAADTAAAASTPASGEKKASNGVVGAKGREGGGGGGVRPPAKGAELEWGEAGLGHGAGDVDPSPPVLEGLTTDVRREDAFFELFCEKNMMSRFLDLLRSPSSRYVSKSGRPGDKRSGGSGGASSSSSASTPAASPGWGDSGGLDAVIRAITWGGDVLGRGQSSTTPAERRDTGRRQGQGHGQGRGERGGGSVRRSGGVGGSEARGEERSSAELQVQVIQTTSILVMNVKSDTSLFYLLSNNHVNDMIMFDFRLEDEEVLSHFASFLKTLSLRLNENTVQFFLRGQRRKSPRQRSPKIRDASTSPVPENASATRGPHPTGQQSRGSTGQQEREGATVSGATGGRGGRGGAAGGGASPEVQRRESGETGGSNRQEAQGVGNGKGMMVGDKGRAVQEVEREREKEENQEGDGGDDDDDDDEEEEEQEEQEEQEGTSFPLYTRALEYICHGDFHVRIAALTVVLNIYNQRDPLVRAYLNGPAARSASLPDRLVGALRSQCLVLADSAMAAGVGGGGGAAGGVGERRGRGASASSGGSGGAAAIDPSICRDSIAGLQDQVFYLEDVFASGQRELNAQLCDSLLNRLVRPMLLGDWLSGRSGAMFPQVALCALAQLFIVLTYAPLVRLLVLETLGSVSGQWSRAVEGAAAAGATPTDNVAAVGVVRTASGMGSSPPLLALLQGDREELCLGALVVLQALAQNRVVRSDLGLSKDPGAGSDSPDDFPAYDAEGLVGKAGKGDGSNGGGSSASEEGHARADALEKASVCALDVEVLDAAVDALCCMLAPSAVGVQAIATEKPHSENPKGSDVGGGAGEAGGGCREVGEVTGTNTVSLTSVLGNDRGVVGAGKEDKMTLDPERRRNSGGVAHRELSVRESATRPRRHHLVLRLCGKVLASLAPPVAAPPAPDSSAEGGGEVEDAPNRRQDSLPTSTPIASAGSISVNIGASRVDGPGENVKLEAGAVNGGAGGGRRGAMLRRIRDAHAAAAEAVLKVMENMEGAFIVAFEEEIREWSKRVGLDGAITNLPKMSSLILRWSLDNTTAVKPQSPPEESPSPCPPGGSSGTDAKSGIGAGSERARQRELRSALQAFLEVRQVWRLLSGKGETDPSVLSIADLGPQGEEAPREGGSLDLGGRECLACSISDPVEGGGGDVGGGGSVRNRRTVVAAAIAAASAGRRGRSEMYLVLDAKAFLLATPDRHKLMNGEIQSSAPLLHIAAVADPANKKCLHIRALSHRSVALMRPVTAPISSTSTCGTVGSRDRDKAPRSKGGVVETNGNGGYGPEESGGGGDAGSMCDMQAWACELSFENERSCRLARKHMEGRRLLLRSQKTKGIIDLLEACVEGRDD